MEGPLTAHVDSDFGLIGQSAVMAELRSQIRDAAKSSATVLITGETGTGKELVTLALHKTSKRRSGPLLHMNCAALSTQLLESELFGHVRGAFTGAIEDRKGKFEAACGGTIVLDEINSTDLNFQGKLLRVIEEKAVIPVGSNDRLKIDVRIIATSNQNLTDEVTAGRFRQDLFYRLEVLPIRVPALRDRDDDVLLLADHFMRKFCQEEGKEFACLSIEAQTILKRHRWPGNVRELEHKIQRAVVHSKTSGADATLKITTDLFETPLSLKDSASPDVIVDFVFDDLLSNNIPLKGLRRGDKQAGRVAAAVVDAIGKGLERYLASPAGQELLSKGIRVGYLMIKMGLKERKGGKPSQLDTMLRQKIKDVFSAATKDE